MKLLLHLHTLLVSNALNVNWLKRGAVVLCDDKLWPGGIANLPVMCPEEAEICIASAKYTCN